MKEFVSFLLGAIAGAAVTAFMTPVTGDELRKRVREKLNSMVNTRNEDIDELVEMIAAEIEKKQ